MTAGSREGECAHGHPTRREVVGGWVEERSAPFENGKGCRLCDPSVVLLRYAAEPGSTPAPPAPAPAPPVPWVTLSFSPASSGSTPEARAEFVKLVREAVGGEVKVVTP